MVIPLDAIYLPFDGKNIIDGNKPSEELQFDSPLHAI